MSEDRNESNDNNKTENKLEQDESKSDEKKLDENTTESTGNNHTEHIHYETDGSAIYTDPQTKYQYKWCTKENIWKPLEGNHFTNNDKKNQNTETEYYRWDTEKNEWLLKNPISNDGTGSSSSGKDNVEYPIYGIDDEGQHIYTDKDGAIFFWDVERNAWFPKIDDDFMARYQMNYGFIDNSTTRTTTVSGTNNNTNVSSINNVNTITKENNASSNQSQTNKEIEANKNINNVGVKSTEEKRKRGPPEPPKWFEIDPAHNTKVYVSNLPLDITIDEFIELMSKCGMIMRDPNTQKYKVKLYTEADGQIKGDGLCDYIKVESVHLAIQILDEYNLRGNKIRVQRAQFQMRGEYNPALKPKRKKKDKEKMVKLKEKLFDWRPEKLRGERSKHEKIVIIKNLFEPKMFEQNVQRILDYHNELRDECNKYGQVRKVIIYDRHVDGVAQVNMSCPEEADLVIQYMQGRFFGKRQLTAEHWDGKTKYKVDETASETQERLSNWDQYLEEGDEEGETNDKNGTENKTSDSVHSVEEKVIACTTYSDDNVSQQE